MRKLTIALLGLGLLVGSFGGGFLLTALTGGNATEETDITPDASTAAGSTAGSTAGSGVDGGSYTGFDTTRPVEEVRADATAAMGGDFGRPPTFVRLSFDLDAILSEYNINTLARERVRAYTYVAWHDAYRNASIPAIISSSGGGATVDEALAVAGTVAADLIGLESIREDVAGWGIELNERMKLVHADIIARANADGYNATAGAVAPTYENEPAWSPGGAIFPGGLEPAWGSIKPILVEVAACPVPAAPRESILAERAALTGAAADITLDAAELAAVRFATLETSSSLTGAFTYAHGRAVRIFDRLTMPLPMDQEVHEHVVGVVMVYDLAIAAWNAKWDNGVASPLETTGANDSAVNLVAPSYPSWPAAFFSAMASYMSGALGKDVTPDEVIDLYTQTWTALTNAESQDMPIPLVHMYNALQDNYIHWSADIKAGESLGECVAAEALKAAAG